MSALLLPLRHFSAAQVTSFSFAALPCFSHRRVAARSGWCTLHWVVL